MQWTIDLDREEIKKKNDFAFCWKIVPVQLLQSLTTTTPNYFFSRNLQYFYKVLLLYSVLYYVNICYPHPSLFASAELTKLRSLVCKCQLKTNELYAKLERCKKKKSKKLEPNERNWWLINNHQFHYTLIIINALKV